MMVHYQQLNRNIISLFLFTTLNNLEARYVFYCELFKVADNIIKGDKIYNFCQILLVT